MKISSKVDAKIGVMDIETFRELFDVGIYDPDTKQWHEHQISKYKNDLYSFIKYYTPKCYDYLVTFNGISFDHQVIEWILENYENWYNLSNLEICHRISEFSQELIDNSNYGLFLPYKEDKFVIPSIDLFRIHHFDNENRRTSLKW